MRREASLLFALLIAFRIAMGFTEASPLLVCRLTGQTTPVSVSDARGPLDDCCEEEPVYQNGHIAGHSLRVAPCCHITSAAEQESPVVLVAVPLLALPPATPNVFTAPIDAPYTVVLPGIFRQTAPRGPPLRRFPPRAPPNVS